MEEEEEEEEEEASFSAKKFEPRGLSYALPILLSLSLSLLLTAQSLRNSQQEKNK